MAIKVDKAEGTPKRTATEFSLDLEGIPKDQRSNVKADVAEYIIEQVLKSIADETSPIAGEKWPKLSPEYAKKKKAEVNNTQANLDLTGDLLDSFTYKTTKEGIAIGFFSEQAWKADGHLKFSGEKNFTPKRRFLPDEGQQFKPDIERGIERILIDARTESTDFPVEDLKQLETKTDIYDYFGDKLDLESRSEIKLAILRNEDLVAELRDLGLLDLL